MIWQIEPYVEEYAIAGKSPRDLPCLLIPGWSFDATIFEWLLPGLAQKFRVSTAQLATFQDTVTKDRIIDEIARSINEPTWLIGWSMGGNIAIEIAFRHPEKVLGLCLISTTPHFIESPDWLVGMHLTDFNKFRDGLLINADKTLRKFDLLQTRGDAQEKNLRHALQQYRMQQKAVVAEDLAFQLAMLGEFDQREILKKLTLPMYWCFGELDALVNAYTAYEIKALCPLAEVQVFRQTTHALFLTNPDKFFKGFLHLLDKDKVRAGKRKVAASFSRAATKYDQSAILQCKVADKLVSQVDSSHGYLLDAGCGTGYALPALTAKADIVISLDMAHGMLKYGRQRYPAMKHLVESDIECLPFADHSMTCIFSSLAVQWCTNVSLLLEEWDRVLKPGGRAYIATLGENTLHELRNSWAEVDGYQHVNSFLPAEVLCEEVYQSPFALKKMSDEDHVFQYDDVKSLMRDLKNIGAQTVVRDSAKGLMGKQRFVQLEQAYEKYRNKDGRLPATYEVIYMVLEKHT
jgi:malonyl-CoA O-methyltransferase